MSTGPFQPIPDATQPFVDRLVGSQVGEHRIEARVCEGRYGTLYRATVVSSGQPRLIQALRSGLTGSDDIVQAANALRFPGIAVVSGSGELPDGRRYRVLEALEGESLDQLLQRRGPLPAREAAELLARVATVLEAAHAWALPHGCLGPSSVFVAGGEVKLFDFGLSRQPATIVLDLRALGLLGFTLLTGVDVTEGEAPESDARIPGPLDRLLRDLLEGRVQSATEARLAFERLAPEVSSGPAPASARVAPPAAKRGRWLALVGGLAILVAGALLVRPTAPATEPAATPAEEDDTAALDEAIDDAVDEPGPPSTEPAPSTEPSPTPRPPKTNRPPRPVPTAEALSAQISKLEARLRREARPGDDVAQALYVLNKQRLRLAGSPSVADRREVAQQLAGWKRSYLR